MVSQRLEDCAALFSRRAGLDQRPDRGGDVLKTDFADELKRELRILLSRAGEEAALRILIRDIRVQGGIFLHPVQCGARIFLRPFHKCGGNQQLGHLVLPQHFRRGGHHFQRERRAIFNDGQDDAGQQVSAGLTGQAVIAVEGIQKRFELRGIQPFQGGDELPAASLEILSGVTTLPLVRLRLARVGGEPTDQRTRFGGAFLALPLGHPSPFHIR